jgi:hypothetical protein
MIHSMENRLVYSETIYLVINILIFFTSIFCLNLVKYLSSSYF